MQTQANVNINTVSQRGVSVSYTHLDVYKRQALAEISTEISCNFFHLSLQKIYFIHLNSLCFNKMCSQCVRTFPFSMLRFTAKPKKLSVTSLNSYP